jgi:hypothetical protein
MNIALIGMKTITASSGTSACSDSIHGTVRVLIPQVLPIK